MSAVLMLTEKDFELSGNGRLETWDRIAAFLWAGNATFTLVSLKTGARFTYRLRVKKEDVEAKLEDMTFFLSLLRGPDNTSDYAYMGVVRKPGKFFLTSASRMNREAPAVQAFIWFIERLRLERGEVLGKLLEVWHDGK